MSKLSDGSVYYIFGIMTLLAAVLFIVCGLVYLFGFIESYSVTESENAAWMMLGICTPITLAVGLIILAVGLHIKKKVRELEDLAGLLRTYRRIKLAEIALKVGKPEVEANKMVWRCIETGLVEGHVDRTTGEFFLKESIRDAVPVYKCENCGAVVENVFLEGETARCNYCGHRLGQKATMTPDQLVVDHGDFRCNICERKLRFIEKSGKWYCDKCKRYI